MALGAHHTIDSSKEGALEVLMKLTNGGVDISVEFAGAISALDFAFQSTKEVELQLLLPYHIQMHDCNYHQLC